MHIQPLIVVRTWLRWWDNSSGDTVLCFQISWCMATIAMLHAKHHSASDYCPLMGLPWGTFFLFSPFVIRIMVTGYTRTQTHTHTSPGSAKWLLVMFLWARQLNSNCAARPVVKDCNPPIWTCQQYREQQQHAQSFGSLHLLLWPQRCGETITGHGAEQNDSWKHLTMSEN